MATITTISAEIIVVETEASAAVTKEIVVAIAKTTTIRTGLKMVVVSKPNSLLL